MQPINLVILVGVAQLLCVTIFYQYVVDGKRLSKKSLSSYAVKSAAPVAACVASLFKVALHTAPLCPSKVPIQSPVSPCRNIGFPSKCNDKTVSLV